MNDLTEPHFTDKQILNLRGKKNSVDPHRPYAWLVERELSDEGEVEETGVVFLTNRECPFHCLMCDLWKNTTDDTIPSGAIPEQIEWALEQMPGIKQVKLYNSGSFFDPRTIPEHEYKRIASLLKDMRRVIVESHPAFINDRCLTLSRMLKPDLEVALGLEIADDAFLGKLNKKMTLDDFTRSVHFLSLHGIDTRAFILLRPPFMSEEEGILMAERSIDFAFASGVKCCVVIPVRAGNGTMESLAGQGLFSPPEIKSLEKVIEYGIGLDRGRVFADTWDLPLFSSCDICLDRRISRLNEMNLSQRIPEAVECSCNSSN